MAVGSGVETSGEGAGAFFGGRPIDSAMAITMSPIEQQHAGHDRRRLGRIELIDRDERVIGRDQAEHRRGDEEHHRDGDDGGLPERALERFLDPSANLQSGEERHCRAEHGGLPLAPGEHAEQEAEAYGDGDRRKRVLPDCLFRLVAVSTALSWARLICLLAMRETVEVRLWMIGANGVDLIGQFLRCRGSCSSCRGHRYRSRTWVYLPWIVWGSRSNGNALPYVGFLGQL